MSIQNLKARIGLLESGFGFVTLNDGTKFRPKDSDIGMLFDATKLKRDLRREPMIADFPVEEQEKWNCYAKWRPDPSEHGQISVLLVRMTKKIAVED